MSGDIASSLNMRKIPKWSDHSAADGKNINPGPFVGIVKSNTDPMRSGRLQVYIPELGGSPEDDASWRTVHYMTPFWGSTNNRQGPKNSYGMWFVPPDVGVRVLCMFVNGDPHRGYWMGCIPDFPFSHMVPGISGQASNPTVPVQEMDDSSTHQTDNLKNFANFSRQPHNVQGAIWQNQGISQDPDRGPGTSSMYRETPSSVFGISTPGQVNGQIQYEQDPDKVGSGLEKTYESIVNSRKGGHTFVMDDGDSNGNNAVMRLRSASGHMILMNDTKEFFYIINNKGTAWLELTAQGDIHVFAQSKMNITAKAGFNLETEGDIQLHAKSGGTGGAGGANYNAREGSGSGGGGGGNIQIKADTSINLESKNINIKADGSTKIYGKESLHLLGKNTYLTGDSCVQIASGGHIDMKGSCVTINTKNATKAKKADEAKKPDKMPTHEPFNRAGAGGSTGTPPSPDSGQEGSTETNPTTPSANGSSPGLSGFGGGSSSPSGVGGDTTQNPQSQPSYNSTSGLPGGSAGQYGAAGNYGDPYMPQSNYGPMTNDLGSIVYNLGMQGSYRGQASNYSSYIPELGGTLNDIVTGAVGGLALASMFGKSSSNTSTNTNSNYVYGTGQLYTSTANIKNINWGEGATFDVGTNSTILNNPAATSEFSQGERQNNPGNLQYNDSDPWAIGYANNLAVYATPEDGIASLSNLFDTYSSGQFSTNIQLCAAFMQMDINDNRVIGFARYVEFFTGIATTSFVILDDPRTRLSWTSAVIEYIQGRIIYSFEQMIAGCADSIGMEAALFAQYVQNGTKPWQNGANQGGFVSPTSSSSQNGFSSIIGGLMLLGQARNIGNAIGSLFGETKTTAGSTATSGPEAGGSSTVYGGYSGIPPTTSNIPYGSDGSTFSGQSNNNLYITEGGLSDQYVNFSGATVNYTYQSVLKNGYVYGNSECAGIVQDPNGNSLVGGVTSLQRGDAVLDNTSIAPGTMITTFNYTDANGNPSYAPPGSLGERGSSHVALYYGQGQDENGKYIIVQDQWRGQPAQIRKIYANSSNPNEAAGKFYIAKTPVNGYAATGWQAGKTTGYPKISPNPISLTAPTSENNAYKFYEDATPLVDTALPTRFAGQTGFFATENAILSQNPDAAGLTTFTGKQYDSYVDSKAFMTDQEISSVADPFSINPSSVGLKYDVRTGDVVPDYSSATLNYSYVPFNLAAGTSYSPGGSVTQNTFSPTFNESYTGISPTFTPSSTGYTQDVYYSGSLNDRLPGDPTGSAGYIEPPYYGKIETYGAEFSPLAVNQLPKEAGPISTPYTNPGDLASGGTVQSAPSQTLTTTYDPITGQQRVVGGPVTGQQPAPGQSGAAQGGGQATPGGSAQTGMGAASC